jgi:hypothetical protein
VQAVGGDRRPGHLLEDDHVGSGAAEGKGALPAFPWVVSCPLWQRWAQSAHAEHCQRDQRVG